MSAQRIRLAGDLAAKIGADLCSVVDAGNGWPTTMRMRIGDEDRLVDCYVSLVGSHARRDYELRFQNPAQEDQRLIERRGNAIPLLVGVSRKDDGDLVAVVPDTDRRVGNTNRFSVLFRKELVDDARDNHWSDYHSSTGEVITAVSPTLLPYFIMLRLEGVAVPLADVRVAIADTVSDEGAITEISRRAVMRVVRDARFRKSVVVAYSGRCVLCGLNWGLIEAAHIYPISAPSSSDAVANGLGLCGNHHALFDAHRIHIDPSNLQVSLDRDLWVQPGPAGLTFLNGTADRLRFPAVVNERVSRQWLERRYNWFEQKYGWVG